MFIVNLINNYYCSVQYITQLCIKYTNIKLLIPIKCNVVVITQLCICLLSRIVNNV